MPALCDMTCHKCKFRFGYRVEDVTAPPEVVYCPSCGEAHDMRETNEILDKARTEQLAGIPPEGFTEITAVLQPELFMEFNCWDCGERNRVRELSQTEAFCSACSTQLHLEDAREAIMKRPDVAQRWRLIGKHRSDTPRKTGL